jgi:hypothetical protein
MRFNGDFPDAAAHALQAVRSRQGRWRAVRIAHALHRAGWR